MKRLALIVFSAVLLCASGSAQTVPAGRLLPPGSLEFFKDVVKDKGLFPAIICTADYMTRSGRIGSAQHHHDIPEATVPETAVSPSVRRYTADTYASDDFGFIDYLIGNGMEQDAVTILSSGKYFASDTLQYLKGWANYSAKNLAQASAAFDKVPKGSPFYDKSLFFNVISNAHLGRYDQSSALLESYDGPYKELKSLEEAGIALLQGRAADFISASEGFTFSQYALTDSERQLQGVFNDRFYGRHKSPLLAAAASAVIPGLGKVYAGEFAEGISSFLTVGSLAAITAENWSRNGFTNWKTLLFGTVGAIFYIGNIYGSYVSVSIHENDLGNAQDTAILYHIHIPLRSVFR